MKLVDQLGSWYPETVDGFGQRWAGDEGSLGPSSRIDDLFDVR